MQMDTKYILDKKSLPASAYNHVRIRGLPLYEWNIIDAKTRIKFTGDLSKNCVKTDYCISLR